MQKKSSLYAALITGLLFLWAPTSQGQDLTLDNLSSSDMEKIVKEFTGAYTHTSISGGNTLGSIFGFEVGLVAGFSSSDNLQEIVKREDPNASDLPLFPSGGLLGRLTVPYGLTAELLLIPEVGNDDFKFQNMSAALMWSPTQSLLSFLPFSLGFKAHYAQTKIDFKIPDAGGSGVDVDTSYDNTIYGAQVLASINLLLVEPYVGLGFVSGDGELTYTGSGTIFDSAVTSSNSASKSVSGAQLVMGAELKLLLFKLAAEYSNHLDVDRYGLKASVYF